MEEYLFKFIIFLLLTLNIYALDLVKIYRYEGIDSVEKEIENRLKDITYWQEYFKDKKIGIFFKFKAEWLALKEVFGDNLTDDIEEFDNTNKNIALQVLSGREGVSLRNADCLVFYNLDFSATSYFQARERCSHLGRLENNVYWIFSDGGIENKIYKAVQSKKSYTLSRFKKDYKIK